MTTWAALRLAKFLLVVLFGAGVLGTAFGRAPADRRFAVAAWLTPGFIGTWLLGYAMLEVTGASMGERWISVAMLGSLASFAGAVAAAGSGQARNMWAGLGVAGFVASLGIMVARDMSGMAPVYGVSLAAGVLVGLTARVELGDEVVPERWFAWVARAEGVSLLLLFGVAMPLKYAAGFEDATKLAGMGHGVLFLAYLVALGRTATLARWNAATLLAGFGASMVPFGTFALEWWLGRQPPAEY